STTLTTCCRGLRRTSRVRLKRMRIPKLLGWIYQNVVAVEPAKTPDNTCNPMFLFNFLAPLSLWVRLRTARDKLWTKSGTGFHPQLVHNPSPGFPGDLIRSACAAACPSPHAACRRFPAVRGSPCRRA